MTAKKTKSEKELWKSFSNCSCGNTKDMLEMMKEFHKDKKGGFNCSEMMQEMCKEQFGKKEK